MSLLSVARRPARLRRAFILGVALVALSLPSIGAAQSLSLNEALARVLVGSPITAIDTAQRDIANAAIGQAGVRPRDTIGVDLEDFAGTGPYSPVDRSQTTAWYERTFERGGKRDARIDAARSDAGVTAIRSRLRMLDLLAQAQAAWVEALAAEAAVPLAEQRLAEAQRVEAETRRRVARALDPLFSAERARTATATARLAVDQASETARIARAGLAAYWSGPSDYSLDASSFERTEPAGNAGKDSPDLSLYTAERDAADARARLVRTGDAGDPTGRLGLRHIGDGNELALIVGGSLPIGNRAANRGNVARAHAERQQAEAEIALARLDLQRETSRLTAERAMLASEIARIERDILPGAQRAASLARQGFARGGTAFTFLEVNQAQIALFDARARRVDLLRRFHLAGARFDRLAGRHAPLLASVENR